MKNLKYMTICLHTPRSLWGNSWQKITWPLSPHPAYLRFLRVPENETPVQRATFRIDWRDPSRIATGTKHANAARLQWVLPKMANSLGSLYTSPRWLLRRWRWKLGLKVVIHVITSKFSEILGRPRKQNLVILKKLNWSAELCLYLIVHYTGSVGETVSVIWYQRVL